MSNILKCWFSFLTFVLFSTLQVQGQLTRYHYWFDGDFGNPTTIEGVLETIDCSRLKVGVHQLHVYAEKDGEVSPPKSVWFLRGVIPDDNKNVDLLVFIDGEYYSTVKAQASGLTPIDLDLMSLEKGTHKISVHAATPEYVLPEIWEAEFESEGFASGNDLTMRITDSEGSDVTDMVTIEWKRNGEVIGYGSKLSGVEVGDILKYNVILQEDLGKIYKDIRAVEYVVPEGQSSVEIALIPFEPVKVNGYVHTDNMGAGGVKIDIIQYPNDRFSIKSSVETAEDGSFEIDLINVPTRFELSGKGYIATDKVIEELMADNVLPLDINILQEGKESIQLDINYYAATTDGPLKQNFIGVDGDINYTLRCNGSVLMTGIYQNNVLPLPDNIEAGSSLSLELASASGLFDAVGGSTIYQEGNSALISINIVEKGGVESRYTSGDAPINSAAYLYSADGRLVSSNQYAEKVTFKGLDNGKYIIVSLVNDGALGVPASIEYLSSLGLNVGSDYLLHRVDVEEGRIVPISLDNIPLPDMTWMAEITSGAIFSASKTSVTASEFVSATVNLNLSDDVLDKTESGVLTISLPENCMFEPGSMLVNGKVAPASDQDGQISIRLDKDQLSSRVRFCLSSLAGGDYNVSAYLALNMGGGEITCPIEPLWYHASDYAFYVPAKTSSPSINITGVAAADSHLEIYDGDNLIGSAEADAYGNWHAYVDLYEPRNNSNHQVWTLTTGRSGNAFASQSQRCSYNEKYIVPKSVTMVNTAHKMGVDAPVEVKTVFDLEGDRNVSSRYYLYWPSYPDFTFLIDFERNDPNQIGSVLLNVFTENDNTITLPAEFDQSLQRWMTHYSFKEDDLPTNVSVSYSENINEDIVIDASKKFDVFDSLESIDKDKATIDSLMKELSEAYVNNDDEAFDEITSRILRYMPGDYEILVSETEIGNLLNDIERIPMDEIPGKVESFLPPLSNDESIPGMEDIEKFLKDFSLPKEEIEESLSNDIKTIFTPPSEIDETISYPKEITIENINQIVNNRTNIVKAKFDNGYTMSIDISEARKNVSSVLEVSNENPICDFIDNLESFLDIPEPEWMPYISEIVSTCESAAEVAEHWRAEHKERYRGWRELFHRTRFSTHPNIKILNQISKDAVLEEWKEWAQVTPYMKDIERAKVLGKIFTAYDFATTIQSIIGTINECCKDYKSWDNLIAWAKLKCSPDIRDKFLSEIYTQRNFHRTELTIVMTSSIVFRLGSLGGSLAKHPIAAFGISMGCSLAGEGFNNIYPRVNGYYQKIRSDIGMRLFNHSECGDDPRKRDYPKPPYPRNGSDPIRDPSGIVYEGVVSMPVEGVTSTLFFNETTEGEGKPWSADEYGQINPQSTDAMGMYGWDVPRGNYRVVFEKEGYETASTEWLPVPPPQLDVNVSLRKLAPAAIKNAKAHKDEITVEFDTYMDVSTLTSENMFVEANGRTLEGTIEQVNPVGKSPEPVLASKFRIIPKQSITHREVTLVVKPDVESYSGVKMPDEVRRVLTVEEPISDLIAPADFSIAYGEDAKMRVHALPPDAVVGKLLNVVSSSSLIIDISNEKVEFDEHGYATIEIEGLIPGNAALTMSVDGYDGSAITRITVGNSTTPIIPAPEASISSGSVVARGTFLNLSSTIPGAVIYYTLDGSCPCDPTSSRKRFDTEEPIVIDRNMTVKAMCIVDNNESEIVSFNYLVRAIITGVDGVDRDDVKVYPIPVKDILHVETPWNSESAVSIYNLSGALVKRETISGKGGSIDVTSLSPGAYVLMLRGEETKSIRIIKE